MCHGGSSPGPLDVLCSVDVAKLAQAETVTARRVHVAVHSDNGTRRWHLEGLANLNVHLKVGDGAPVLWGCGTKSTVKLAVRVFVK